MPDEYKKCLHNYADKDDWIHHKCVTGQIKETYVKRKYVNGKYKITIWRKYCCRTVKKV
jgi:hypothetical protein